jgi:uncharacterized protein (TIGR02444 family)
MLVMPMTTPESFWNFAVRTYRCEGIPEACIALQDERGADVNVVLFCCWMGATRGEFEDESFDRVLEFSRAWADHVVRPLRAVRTWMKFEGCPDPAMLVENCMNLRERIKKVELQAEQLQENVMQSIVDAIPGVTLGVAEQARAAMANLSRYFAAEGIDWDSETQARLDFILQAAIPRTPTEQQ